MNKLSIIIPCYNEEKRIGVALEKLAAFLREKQWIVEIIIANDGSVDRTVENALQVADDVGLRASVRVVEHHPNRGRGAILNKAFSVAKSEKICYMDADLSYDVKYLNPLMKALDESTIVTGSRHLPTSTVFRSLKREILSRTYNLLVRMVFTSPIKDHQCGFKGFRKECLSNVLPYIRSERWFWDTEFLLVSRAMGYQIYEFPIVCQEYRKKGESKVNLVNTIASYLKKLVWLKIRISKYPRIRSLVRKKYTTAKSKNRMEVIRGYSGSSSDSL